MNRLLSVLIAAVLALGLTLESAEAARMGGGRSLGAQRSSIAPSGSTSAPAKAAPSTPSSAPAAAPAPAGNRWLAPIAGLAAGLGLGWLLSQGGLGGLMGSLLMMALIAFAVIFVMRLFTQSKTASKMQYAGLGNAPGAAPPPPAGLGAAPTFGARPEPNIPADFDTAGFLRQAKLNFNKLQSVHDSGKLDELREFTTDEMFKLLKQDLQQRGAGTQQTDVVTLNADLLEVATDGDTHWASVRFSGMIRESANAQPEAFEEVWNLAKPVSGATGWVLAGIQQLQ